MMCALTDLSVLMYSQSPKREFLSGICNISCRSEQSCRNNNNNKTVFDMWRGCSDSFKTFGRTAGSSIAFHVLKEPSHSNGSSEALRCPPSPKRVGDCVGLRPDAPAAPPSLLLLKIPLWLFWRARPWQSARLQTQAPPFERCPWTSVAKHRFPLCVEIRDADEGKHWCFQMLFCLLVKQCPQHNVLSRVQCAANTNAEIKQTHYCTQILHHGQLKWCQH